jgi:hypothetical protein
VGGPEASATVAGLHAEPLPVRIRIGDRTVAPTLPAESFSTLVVKASPGSAA